MAEEKKIIVIGSTVGGFRMVQSLNHLLSEITLINNEETAATRYIVEPKAQEIRIDGPRNRAERRKAKRAQRKRGR